MFLPEKWLVFTNKNFFQKVKRNYTYRPCKFYYYYYYFTVSRRLSVYKYIRHLCKERVSSKFTVITKIYYIWIFNSITIKLII